MNAFYRRLTEALRDARQPPDMLRRSLLDLRPRLAAAAQEVYDAWDPEHDDGDPDFGSGGICDAVAEALGHVLAMADIDFTLGGQDGDDHAYLIAYDPTHSFVVDVPYGRYETGSDYSWQKVPDVQFTPDDVEIVPCHRPDWIDTA